MNVPAPVVKRKSVQLQSDVRAIFCDFEKNEIEMTLGYSIRVLEKEQAETFGLIFTGMRVPKLWCCVARDVPLYV